MVEPVEVGFVVGDPFLDRLPRWLDGLGGGAHGPDGSGDVEQAQEAGEARSEAWLLWRVSSFSCLHTLAPPPCDTTSPTRLHSSPRQCR